MNTYIWVCRTCGHESFHGPAVKEHRETTGHLGAQLLFDGHRPGDGGSYEARQAALEACRASIAAAKRRTCATDTTRCIVHDQTYVNVCPGCRADEIAAEESA